MPRILSRLPRPTPRTLPHTEKATTFTEPRVLRSRGTSFTESLHASSAMNHLDSSHISMCKLFSRVYAAGEIVQVVRLDEAKEDISI